MRIKNWIDWPYLGLVLSILAAVMYGGVIYFLYKSLIPSDPELAKAFWTQPASNRTVWTCMVIIILANAFMNNNKKS